jgi:hypothetical protein
MTLDISIEDAGYLMARARMTAVTYMREGIEWIDKEFGDGYAKRHPELLAAFMRTCAADFHSGDMKAGLQDIRDALRALSDITEAIRPTPG